MRILQNLKRGLNRGLARFGIVLVSPIRRLQKKELRQLFHQEKLFFTRHLKGAIVECGVREGHGLSFFYKTDRDQGGHRKLWGFDTFEGFPEASPQDGDYLPTHKEVRKNYRTFSLERAISFLKKSGLGDEALESVRLVKGVIPDSFSEYSGEKVSFLNIDVDLYAPTLSSLQFFWPLMELGGIIVFDEYDFERDIKKWPGPKIAIDEFCLEHKLELSRHFSGRMFLVKSHE